MLQLRRLLRQQLLEALFAPVRRSRHHGRRGGAPADDAHRTNDLAARRGPPVPPDSCTAEGCILGASRARGPPTPREVTSYCPTIGGRVHHGWTSFVRDEGEATAAAPHVFGHASPRRSPSPVYSPETPPYTPTPLEPPGFELPLTMSARRGALPFYNDGASSSAAAEVVNDDPDLAPPPPPPAPA
ncbi:hypothetical protein PVAP13_9KG314357, partial [Panicum virgatum]